MTDQVLRGRQVTLEPISELHAGVVRRILRTPEVWHRWGDDNIDATWPLEETDEVRYAVQESGVTVGLIQYGEELDPKYRHANVDIFLDPKVHGRGLGRDAITTLVNHLLGARRHHRIVIDPAADNEAAIRCYAAVGFQPVGRMRKYERDASGQAWHDGILMELIDQDVRALAH
ncbi:GNAT family protein [Micromonospora sp. NPDC005324]|uniref:GNAT family N-acetyltransferase n=1 Tax=Micromonospora sp. NPDC005324 TaxID=3157033 RepID=UPI00339EBDF6